MQRAWANSGVLDVKALDIPVEIAGYENRRLVTYDPRTGEVIERWWSVKRGMNWVEFNHFICGLLRGRTTGR